MIEENEAAKESNWRRFFRKHWAAFAVMVVATVLAFAYLVYVFVWFTGYAQSTGLVPSSIGLWSMENLVLFILHANRGAIVKRHPSCRRRSHWLVMVEETAKRRKIPSVWEEKLQVK